MTDHFKQQGPALIDNGYLIVPIRRGEKRPAIDGWQKARLGMGDLGQYPDHGAGILCGQGANPIIGIDIDISHPVIGASLIKWCQENLGYGGERVGAAPRILLAYRAAESGWAKGNSVMFFDPTDPVKPNGKKNQQQVEILGLGQQFVAYHEHPDTLADYEWVDLMGGLEHINASDLPVVTEAHIEELLAEVYRLVQQTPGVTITGRTESVAYRGGQDELAGLTPRTDTPFAEISALVDYLVNDGDDYDYWLHVGAALHHEYAGTEHEAAALQLWKEYGSRSSKNDPKQYDYKWKSFGKNTGSAPITLRWLIKECNLLKSVAADEMARHRFEKANAYKLQILASVDEFTLSGKLCSTIAKDAELDSIGRQRLAQALQEQFKKLGSKYTAKQCRDLVAERLPASIQTEPVTHHGYAKGMLETLQSEALGHPVIGADGGLYVAEKSGLYEFLKPDDVIVRVANLYDGGEKCERRSDYKAISDQACSICEREDFFTDAPIGLATPDGFYRMDADGTVNLQPLTPEHRQRHMHPIGPAAGPMPIFKQYLEDTFSSAVDGEHDEQIALVQEIAGAVALGLMSPHEKAALLFGPGRSGKGTALKILEALVPPESVVSVSPFRWGNEYYCAALAGARLNVVGELPDDLPIPAADFKSLLGRDLMSGRHPTHRPFTFRNEAAHIFNSNSYPNTRDHSTAFYTRWLIVSFANSRIDRASIDIQLAARIIAEEMPAVLAWALEGAQRLVRRGRFEETPTHRRHMAQWQRRTDSVMEFLHDQDVCSLDGLGFGLKCKRTALYNAYTAWCGPAGRKPIGKQKFHEALESPTAASIGVTVKRDPVLREVVHGVGLVNSYDVCDSFQ